MVGDASGAKEEMIECADTAEWETWMDANHKQTGGVWLKIAKKGSGKSTITISEALDVALCYGWIDSQRNGYDHAYYLQRYSRRRSKSPWSKLNVERVEALTIAGRMKAAGLAEIEAARKDGRWNAAYESQRKAGIPPDFEAALAQNTRARKVFDLLDKTGQYAVILPILKATTPEQRTARLRKAIATLEKSDQVSDPQRFRKE